MNKLRILEVTNYSAGACGVGSRVLQESRLLADEGHEVRVFSSNRTKGSKEIAPSQEKRGQVLIQRFPAKHLGGEAFLKWDFTRAALEFKPDLIIAHAYRHPHTLQALALAKKLKVHCFLVTHAPFGSPSRSWLARLAVSFYDSPLGPSRKMKEFDKIITVSPWEKPYVQALGVPTEKITCIPNGIASEFFTQVPSKEKKTIFYFGRVSPVKDLETLIKAFALLPQNKFTLEIAGASEPDYLSTLKHLAKKLNISSRVKFTDAIYDTKEKVKKFDSAAIYVLPSLREGMSQSLVEALARGKLVVASDNLGNSALIQNKVNGFLFPVGDASSLALILKDTLDLPPQQSSQIKKAAIRSAKQFAWPLIMKKLNALL